MKCAITRWEDPRLLKVLPGVDIQDGELRFDTLETSCCDGQSFRWDESQTVILKCQLNKRKIMLRKLWQDYKLLWEGFEPPLEGDSSQKSYFLIWLRNIRAGHYAPGFLVRKRAQALAPSLLWTLAFMATWRFGVSCHVFSLDRSKDSRLIPDPNATPGLYFLENVRELWKPEHAEQVNVVANWCEQSRVPLWMELQEPVADEAKQDDGLVDARKMFEARIASLKTRPALEWLGEDCLSRLTRVSR